MAGKREDQSSNEKNDDARLDDALREAMGMGAEASPHASQNTFSMDYPRSSSQGPPPDHDLDANAPLDSPMESIPGYEILREIHRGGQGVVYQAIQIATKRRVAIKVMKEGPFAGKRDKMRFEREVQVLGALRHPNIVNIHDSGIAKGNFYYVMDYISGQPLDVYMVNRKDSIEGTLRLFVKIAEAVNAAHIRGVIHRDLKPGNIRIDTEGEPHILDFGLAKMAVGQVTDESRPQMMTVTGQFVGSLPWSAPEQAEGIPNKIDIRTDVYALGVILYQMLTGAFPYQVMGTMREVLDNVIHAEPTRPSTVRKEIDDEVQTILLKALSKERERRYQSAGELARDLQRYLDGEPIEAKRDSTWYIINKNLRRHRMLVGTVSIIFVLITAGLISSTILWRRAAAMQEAEAVARREAQANAEAVGQINAFITEEIFGYFDPQRLGKAEVTLLEALDHASSAVDTRFAHDPPLQARMHWELGDLYREANRPASSLEHLRKCLSLCEAHPEGTAELRAEALGTRALSLLSYRRLEESIEAFDVAIDAQRSVWGAEDPRVFQTEMLKLVAQRENHGGEEGLAHVVALTSELYERVRSTIGQSHPITWQTLDALTWGQRWNGDVEDALANARQATRGLDSTLGLDHPTTMFAHYNLGVCLKNLGQYEEAARELELVMQWRTKVLKEDHIETLWAITQWAMTMQKLGRGEEGAEGLAEACKDHHKWRHPEAEQSTRGIKVFASTLESLGRRQLAEELFETAAIIEQGGKGAKRDPPTE